MHSLVTILFHIKFTEHVNMLNFMNDKDFVSQFVLHAIYAKVTGQ